MNKKLDRLEWIDIAKGIGIICMIIGHTIAFGSRTSNLIFSFHMPLFFILAGYTIKTTELKDIPKALKKDFFRLIIPVLIMKGVNLIIDLFKGNFIIDSIWCNVRPILWGNGNDYIFLPFLKPIRMYGIGVLWFLIALFWARSLYRLFDIKVKKFRFIILLLCSCIGMKIGLIVRLPQCLDMMPLIMLFMECGKYLKTSVKVDSKNWKIIGIVSFIVWVYLAYGKGIYIEMATRGYPFSIICVFIAIIGCISAIQFSQWLERFRFSKVLSLLGRNSLEILCIHHLDGYINFLWELNIFEKGSTLFFTNEIFSSIARIVLDVILLVIWLFIKKQFQKSKKTISKLQK